MSSSGLTFHNKKYFIHLRDKSMETMTSKEIRNFGAAIVKQLSAMVDFVITDHRSVKTCIMKKQGRATSQSSAASVLRLSIHRPTCSTNDRLGEEDKISANLPVLLKEAYRMGITIMPYQEFNQKLQVHKRSTKGKAPEIKRPSKKPLAAGPIATKTYRLSEPFIKIEDRARQYRPYFEPLARWPQINIQPGRRMGCIFAVDKSKSSPVPEEAELPAAGAAVLKRKRKASRKLDFDLAQSHTQKLNDSAAGAGLTMTTKSRHLGDRRYAGPGYCELCDTKADNLEEHLSSDDHKKHFTSGIFDSLDEEINSGTTLDQFIAQIMNPQTSSRTSSLASPRPSPRRQSGKTSINTRSRVSASPKTPRRRSERQNAAIQSPLFASPKPSPRRQSDRQNIVIQLPFASPKPPHRHLGNLNIDLASPLRPRTAQLFRSPLPNQGQSLSDDDDDSEDGTASPYFNRGVRKSPYRGKTPLKTNLNVFK